MSVAKSVSLMSCLILNSRAESSADSWSQLTRLGLRVSDPIITVRERTSGSKCGEVSIVRKRSGASWRLVLKRSVIWELNAQGASGG
ncbi:hypothetical protein OBBRIDRAFT_356529 [Obba rivulosa]|uniref:Uncharacterized protein n=1 Tax=Obba rivulosa TaxID=1052685 RepID=A0A8E2AI37_9APHY|nr:hypothetical protein OBBRIDRAFT_356529 [Obba rivulosa]